MAKSVKKRAALADIRSSEIREAALKLFGSRGYADVRMEDVAHAAGIAKGTLYLYYQSKDEIYAEAVQQTMEQLRVVTQERLQAVQGFEVRLRTIIEARLEFWGKHRGVHRMLLTIGRQPEHRKQTRSILQKAAESLAQIMQEGIEHGEIAEQPIKPTALALLDMMRGANERRMDGSTKTTVHQDAELLTHIALAALGWKPRRRRSE